MAQPPAPPSSPEHDPLHRAGRPPDRQGDGPRLRPGPQAGNLYLLTDGFGDVHPDTRGLGLYEGDTRRLSCSILRINGTRPVLLQASAGGNYRGAIQLTNPRIERNMEDKVHPEDTIATQKLGISRNRLITGTLLEERVQVVNYEEAPREVELELELAADAADIFEVRGWTRPARGAQLPVAIQPDRVTFRYDGLDGVRMGTHLAFSEPSVEVEAVDHDVAGSATAGWIRMTWRWDLASGEARELRWLAWTTERPRPEPGHPDAEDALFPARPMVDEDRVTASYRAWNSSFTKIRTDNELFNLSIERSAGDLRLLVNDGPGPDERYLAAGVPWFTTLFGRDSLITAFQTLAVRPQVAIETLETLAAYQATEDDPERDMEPGKILHELRTGEMARNRETPHRPYYGTVDATPLWLILFGATFDWTGDRTLVDRLWPNALARARVDRPLRRPRRRRVRGVRAADAARARQPGLEGLVGLHPGSPRPAGPRARRARRGAGLRLRREAPHGRARPSPRRGGPGGRASTRRRRRSAHGSRPPSGQRSSSFYAMALDGEKHKMDAIGSNAGHCLWTGIVSKERAGDVVRRLMAADMFSGWGIRTYAAGQGGYNPIGYHTGTVWPHDTSLIAAGFKRYGYNEDANLLCGRIFEASQHFADFRLPELFCGFDRDISAVPVPYPVACSPQAWAAGSLFLFLETMLGLRPHAAAARAGARPARAAGVARQGDRDRTFGSGDADVDLLFHRWRGGTSAEVIRKSQDLSVTIRM